MDVREKLVELLQDGNNPVWGWFPNNVTMVQLADYLIANGVTVQEWIPVTERLPQNYISVLAFIPTVEPLPTVHEAYIGGDGEWHSTVFYGIEDEDVTHWMPLPHPPKGE